MVGVKRVAALGGIAAVLLGFAGCSSPLLGKIKKVIAEFPFTASAYSFVRQWGNPQPQYSFGSAVVKVDTAGFVYVADSTARIRKFTSSGALLKTYDLASAGNLSIVVNDMAFDSSGNMYVATNGANAIQKYGVSGNLILQWGTSGSINAAAGIAVDSSGDVFVLDGGNNQILKFDSSGNAGTPASWSGKGANNGGTDFNSPNGIVATNGGLYVADTHNNAVKCYDSSSGYYYGQWSIALSGPTGITADTSTSPTFYIADNGNNRIVKTTDGSTINASWGSAGSGNGQFTGLASVAVDSSGNVYAADLPYSGGVAGNGVGRVQKFSGSGTFIDSWGGLALTGNGQLSGPGGVAFDSAGNVYVCDIDNSRIQKFSPTGSYLGQWGNASVFTPWAGSIAVDSAGNVYAPDQTNKCVQVLSSSLVHLKNIGVGTLNSPYSVALDASGNIYVGDYGQIFVFDSNGYTTHVPQTIGTPVNHNPAYDGELGMIVGISVDSAGNVYAVDFPVFYTRPNFIQKFNAKGAFVKAWGASGSGNGQFLYSLGIAADKFDNVYIGDVGNRRVQKFDADGKFIGAWGGIGVGTGTFAFPCGVVVDSEGNVLVSDLGNNLVQLFEPNP
jgi:tripartite motif-containing protein 71